MLTHFSNRNGFDVRTGDGAASTYTVRGGDTLRSVAQAIWGDADLWYKLAEANGLSATSSLTEGQSLSIPTGVWRTHQSASTYIPYDAQRFLSLTDPTPAYPAPAPPKADKGCGGFGQILLVVIAVVVAVYAPTLIPAIAKLGAVGSAAVSAAVGSTVSQAVGVATGIQDKFSFKAVALSALSAGVAVGVGQVVGTGAMAGSKALGDVARGALSNAITQGIATATGLQDKFDWAGVAAAGVISGVGGAVSRSIGGKASGTAGTDSYVPASNNNLAISGLAGGIGLGVPGAGAADRETGRYGNT